MDIKDIPLNEELLDSWKTPEISNNVSEESLQKIGKEKMESLKELIEEVEELIEEREDIAEKNFQECEEIKREINNFLLENKAVDSDDFRERSGLRQKQVEISELQLNEKINCWQDVARLKKELREYQKELSEREGRIDMLNEIMGDK